MLHAPGRGRAGAARAQRRSRWTSRTPDGPPRPPRRGSRRRAPLAVRTRRVQRAVEVPPVPLDALGERIEVLRLGDVELPHVDVPVQRGGCRLGAFPVALERGEQDLRTEVLCSTGDGERHGVVVDDTRDEESLLGQDRHVGAPGGDGGPGRAGRSAASGPSPAQGAQLPRHVATTETRRRRVRRARASRRRRVVRHRGRLPVLRRSARWRLDHGQQAQRLMDPLVADPERLQRQPAPQVALGAREGDLAPEDVVGGLRPGAEGLRVDRGEEVLGADPVPHDQRTAEDRREHAAVGVLVRLVGVQEDPPGEVTGAVTDRGAITIRGVAGGPHSGTTSAQSWPRRRRRSSSRAPQLRVQLQRCRDARAGASCRGLFGAFGAQLRPRRAAGRSRRRRPRRGRRGRHRGRPASRRADAVSCSAARNQVSSGTAMPRSASPTRTAGRSACRRRRACSGRPAVRLHCRVPAPAA